MQGEGPPRLSFMLRVPVPFSGWFARQRGRRIHHVGRCPIPKKGTSHVLLGTLCWASGLFIRAMPPVMAFAGGSLGFLTPFPIQDWMKVLVPILGCMNEARRAGNREGTAPQILHEKLLQGTQKEIPKRTDVVLKVPCQAGVYLVDMVLCNPMLGVHTSLDFKTVQVNRCLDRGDLSSSA